MTILCCFFVIRAVGFSWLHRCSLPGLSGVAIRSSSENYGAVVMFVLCKESSGKVSQIYKLKGQHLLAMGAAHRKRHIIFPISPAGAVQIKCVCKCFCCCALAGLWCLPMGLFDGLHPSLTDSALAGLGRK